MKYDWVANTARNLHHYYSITTFPGDKPDNIYDQWIDHGNEVPHGTHPSELIAPFPGLHDDQTGYPPLFEAALWFEYENPGLAVDDGNSDVPGLSGPGTPNAPAPEEATKPSTGETINKPSTQLADSIRRTYLARAAGGLTTPTRVINAATNNKPLHFTDDGHIRITTDDIRGQFLIRYAQELGKKHGVDATDGKTWKITTGDWKAVYDVLPRGEKHPLHVNPDDGVPTLRQSSFWLGSGENLEGTGTYTIRFYPDPDNPSVTLIDFTEEVKNFDIKVSVRSV